ncbi:MAG TPA: OmpA family protein [Vicinamibacterales bacterium]|nr:OmpA family protein [Vicinamibacterales bacterium]
MANRAAARSDDRRPPEPNGPAAAFTELRSLIVGPEQRQLRTLQARLDDPLTQAREVSQVLPEAVLLRTRDPQLTRALAPTIEEAITASVRKNPQPLADAMFPVIGPAIRKAIAASLSGMLESLNRTLEHSLSWRAVQWRITALRTGKSFAEVVLLNTLVYRVEQVFLIDRQSGLLLLHLKADSAAVPDADLVSAMLTAIRDFARDSFRVSEAEALETLQIGELSVWIEQGPHAILAAVIRGTPPRELRAALQDVIERVHSQHGDALRSFDGDTGPFEAARPLLETCLQVQYHRERKRTSPWLWAIAAGLLLLAGLWLFSILRARARWDAYLDTLRAEPGIVVVSADRQGGKYIVSGLRDPLARDPASLLASHQLSNASVTGTWQLYQALEPPFVLARARELLRTPSGVTLRFADGVLTATGTASPDWIVESLPLARAIPGVTRYDAASLINSEIAAVTQRLEAARLLFIKGTTQLPPDGDQALAACRQDVHFLDALAKASGRRLVLEIRGHADADGPPQSNVPLSARRAERVRAALQVERLQQIDLASTGVGSAEPLTTGPTETDKQRNRRVSLRVLLSGAPEALPNR